jgi:hypothetical protein
MTFDGVNDRLRVSDAASLDTAASAGTFELWIQFVDAADGSYQFILTSSNSFSSGGAGFEWASQPGGGHYFYPWRVDPDNYNLGNNPYTNGQWHHAVATFELATKQVVLYVDGAPLALTVVNVPTHWTSPAAPADWLWGGNPDLANVHFKGALDELRVSSVVRTAGWIATEFANQSSPSTFYAVGAAEQLVP